MPSKYVELGYSRRRKSKKDALFETESHDVPKIEDMMRNTEYYRKQKGKSWVMVEMTPEEYEQAIRRGFMVSQGSENVPSDIRERIHEEHLQKIIGIMEHETVPMPYLDYDYWYDGFRESFRTGFAQEGHHRVEAARRLGAKKVPVFVIYPVKEGEREKVRGMMTKRVREMIGEPEYYEA